MNNIDNLTEEQLRVLQNQIKDKLKKIKGAEKVEIDGKNSIKNKTKLSQLTTNDWIFGIGIGGIRGHSLDENKDELKTWRVFIMDYCKITEYTDKSKRNSEWHRINFSHPTESFGLGTSLTDEQVDKHYILSLDTSTNGYDQFYTLIPETWETDILNAYNDLMESKRKYFEDNSNILRNKLNIYINEKEKIDKFIKNL